MHPASFVDVVLALLHWQQNSWYGSWALAVMHASVKTAWICPPVHMLCGFACVLVNRVQCARGQCAQEGQHAQVPCTCAQAAGMLKSSQHFLSDCGPRLTNCHPTMPPANRAPQQQWPAHFLQLEHRGEQQLCTWQVRISGASRPQTLCLIPLQASAAMACTPPPAGTPRGATALPVAGAYFWGF